MIGSMIERWTGQRAHTGANLHAASLLLMTIARQHKPSMASSSCRAHGLQIVVRDVCKLWHHLRCKLSMRARFWMAFRGQEDHFWEQELRRLAHEISRLQDSPSSAVSPRSHATAVTAHKQLALAEKKLKV